MLKAADLGKKVKVKLSFKDDAGNAESRTSDAYPALGTVNSVATGKPSITGTATVGQTLTAAKGTIADTNGVTRADNGDAGFAYAYQWIRVDSDGTSNPANISGAIYRTYVLKAADRGKKVKVKLSFKDDAGNVESRTSDAYPASATVAAGATWSATLTVQAASASAGCFERVCPTRLTKDKFTHGGIEYTIDSIVLFNGGPLIHLDKQERRPHRALGVDADGRQRDDRQDLQGLRRRGSVIAAGVSPGPTFRA